MMSRFIINPCALRRLFRRDARGLNHARPLVDLTADHYGKLLGEAGGAIHPAYSSDDTTALVEFTANPA
jgi:hypothetical protein